MLPGFHFPAINVGGPDLLARFERQHRRSVDPFSLEANRMSLLVHGGGVFMRLDAEGRLMVTDFIRDYHGDQLRTSPSWGARIIFSFGGRRRFTRRQTAAREDAEETRPRLHDDGERNGGGSWQRNNRSR